MILRVGALKKDAAAIWGIAYQNAAYLAAICDLDLRFSTSTGGRVVAFPSRDRIANPYRGIYRAFSGETGKPAASALG